MCVLTNERYKTYQTGFLFCRRGHALGVGFGVLRGQNQIPSCCPLCYLLRSHWTKFNQIWCVGYPHEWGVQRQFFCPAPWGPGEGSKGQMSLISITKSISKIFIPNFDCVITNERYKTYQLGILFSHLGHALGVGLWGCLGAKIKFRPAVCPLCYLLRNHWTKFNQIWCVGYPHEWGVQRQFFCPAPWGPGEGFKGQMSFNFNYKVNFKDFYTKL